MRYFCFYLFLLLFIFQQNVFSQCPQTGIKFLNKDCRNPEALAVAMINCRELKVKWRGTKNQAYLVKANATNMDTESVTATDLQVSRSTCDNDGNCMATINVIQGITVNWSVQSICNSQGIITYSEPVIGPNTYIPICSSTKKINNKNLQVFPNPSKGKLYIEYFSQSSSDIQLEVYDINGGVVFTKTVKSFSNITNQYEINLKNLAAGDYVLKLSSTSYNAETKFVLMH